MADIAVLGFGARGKIYTLIALEEGFKVVAACDVGAEQRNAAKRIAGIPENRCFAMRTRFSRRVNLPTY